MFFRFEDRLYSEVLKALHYKKQTKENRVRRHYYEPRFIKSMRKVTSIIDGMESIKVEFRERHEKYKNDYYLRGEWHK